MMDIRHDHILHMEKAAVGKTQQSHGTYSGQTGSQKSEDSSVNRYLAVDIGASSGRHIVGWMENGRVCTEEVYRFPNGITEQEGHLTWDIDALEKHVREGIQEALQRFPTIVGLSVDTWAVDYVLMRGSTPVLPCYAYRDSRTEAVIPQVHERMPFLNSTGIRASSFSLSIQSISCMQINWPEGWKASPASR